MKKTKTNNRIAIFLGGYLPARKYGGPVTSISNLVDQLGDEWDFYIISNDHDFNETERLPGIKDGWNEVGKAKVLYIKESEYKTNTFIKILGEINADLVYLSSVFYYRMNFPAIRAAKKLSIPVILAPRGELCEGAMKIKSLKKNLYIKAINFFGILNNVAIQVTSDEEKKDVESLLRVQEEQVFNLPNMPCNTKKKNSKKKEKGILDLVFISRIAEKKNLLFAIKCVKKCQNKINLDIYGPIEDLEYWTKCVNEINDLPNNIRIQYQKTVDPVEVGTVFLKYDAFILPTLSENYGHVITEAMINRCPVIISKGTTPWDDINNNGGYVLPLEKEEKWQEIIDYLSVMDDTEFQEIKVKLDRYVEYKLKIEELKESYTTMFVKLLGAANDN